MLGTSRMAASPAKILVADDSATERQRARNALQPVGHHVVEAEDGQRALEVFAIERPDLVMLDVVMPRLTGLETCRILKAKSQGRYLPVIMLSTRNSVNARVEGLRSGADDYLGKPYDAEELRARVEALLRTRQVLARMERASAPANTRTRMLIDELGVNEQELSGQALLEQRASAEFERAERYSDPLACVRVAIDKHAELVAAHGDEATAHLQVAMRSLIESCIRKIDLVFRLEDGSYTILLPNTHFPGALAVAERVCVEARKLSVAGASLSASVGVSFYPNRDTASASDLLRFVGDALARAQAEGGGNICLFQHQGYLYSPDGA